MDDELVNVTEDAVTDEEDEAVQEDTVQDADIITIPIDTSLTVSGAAADAKTVGDRLAVKVNTTDIANNLTVNGKTPGSEWAVTLYGDDIEVSEQDSRSLVEALEDLETAIGDVEDAVSAEETARQAADTTLQSNIDNEQTARQNADTTLQNSINTANDAISAVAGRVTTLEGHKGLRVTLAISAIGTTTYTVSGMTADHVVTGWVFYDSTNAITADFLADITISTAAGSMTVTVNAVRGSGTVDIWFEYAPAVSATAG